ncbi:MAG: hypothetical protein HeimC3_48370 [Candidatus Heimdallarchaeota archaeon LC_3]|nr:MAG: hypothetical protein HeimC3_48370 [Candidatus Heimdallarchaeota archaeon LC_3]
MSLNPIIGRLLITQREQADPFHFQAWITDSNVEVTQFLIAEDKDRSDRILVMVDSIKTTSSTKSHIEAFFGHSFGNPNEVPASKPPIIRIASLVLLSRTISSVVPPGDSYAIRRPTTEDLNLLHRSIPINRKILDGLLKIDDKVTSPLSWSPIFFDSNMLIGPESGHLNITGVSGMATKSSYAMFLVNSLNEWANRNNEDLSIVIFNVKAQDFLNLHLIPNSLEELVNGLKN